MLSDCQSCVYCSAQQHSTDIGCAVNPSYEGISRRLSSLPANERAGLPITECLDFALKPELKSETLTVTLTRQEWQGRHWE